MSAAAVTMPADFFIGLDRSSAVPLYFQLASRLEEAILTGVLAPGARIENEVSISKRLGLSRPTVGRAIQELVDKGLLVRRRGVGTQVVRGRSTRKMSLGGLFDDLSLDGRHPSTRTLARKLVAAQEGTAQLLGCALGEDVLYLRRLRFSDGEPVAIMENYLPKAFATISEEQLSTHGLYSLMRASGATMAIARQTIGARKPTPAERRLLDMTGSDPVLTMDRVAFDKSGQAVDVGHHIYRPDLYNIEVTIVGR